MRKIDIFAYKKNQKPCRKVGWYLPLYICKLLTLIWVRMFLTTHTTFPLRLIVWVIDGSDTVCPITEEFKL